jgi:hypothetical protein
MPPKEHRPEPCPVVVDGKIYVLGALTGKHPRETPIAHGALN